MRQALHSPRNEAGQKVAGYLCDGTPCGCHGGDGGRGRERSGAEGSQCEKKITIVKCALFIATQNGELGDECKDIWHVQTRDENSGESSGLVARTMD